MKWLFIVSALVLVVGLIVALTIRSPSPRPEIQQAEGAALALDANFVMVNHGEIERLTSYTDFLTPAIEQAPEWVSGLYRQQLRTQMDYLFAFQQGEQISIALNGRFDRQAIMRSLLIDFNVIEHSPSTFQLEQVPVFGSLFIEITEHWILIGDTETSLRHLQQAMLAKSPQAMPKQWQNYRQGKLAAGFALQGKQLDMMSVDLQLASQELALSFRSNHTENLWFSQLPAGIASVFEISDANFNTEASFDAQAVIEMIKALAMAS